MFKMYKENHLLVSMRFVLFLKMFKYDGEKITGKKCAPKEHRLCQIAHSAVLLFQHV